MDELRRQLLEVQEVAGAKKISERSCIDLVQKLIDIDQVKLFHTTTGKEWLTPEQLDHEIRDALASRGGRLGVTDLPAEVGVAIEHIEARVDVLSKKDGSLTRLQGELLSSQYIQGLAQEVEECLAELGHIAVSDLAVRYNLPADFVRDSVLSRISQPHTTKQNTIYTDAYAARVGARARGALRGCTLPVTLAQLAARHRLDADILATAVQKMLKDGSLVGKLAGSTFTPKVYSGAQSSKIDDFYSTNQYLPLSMAKSGGIVVKDWAKEKNIDGVTLSTAFVDIQLVEPAQASVTAAMSSGSWVDVLPLLPASLVAADAKELLLQMKKKLPADALLLDNIAISKKFIQSLSSKFEAEAKSVAERLLSSPMVKAPAKKAAPSPDSDDDDGGGKKKGKRGAKSKKAKADDDDDGAGGGAAASADSSVDIQKVYDLLTDDYPELPTEVHADVCARVQPLLSAMVAEAQNTLRASSQTKRKEQFADEERFVQEQYEKVVYGLKALETKNLAAGPLQQHLIREAVLEPLHRLLSLRWHELSGEALTVTPANRRQCLDQISAKDGAAKAESLARLLAWVTGKKDVKDKEPAKGDKAAKEDKKKGKKGKKGAESSDEEAAPVPESLDAVYHAAASDCHIFCRKVDKKKEKVVVQEATADCKERLKETSQAAKALDVIKEVRQHESFQTLASTDRQICTLPLQLALLQEGVPGLLFPAEAWAMKLVAKSLADEEVQKEALLLCTAVEEAVAAAEEK